ncbi:hypothetical protein L1887_24928 [Cichorium endivia]|nr:hypothetical protein L1887_24928 [Cichorium endivia]
MGMCASIQSTKKRETMLITNGPSSTVKVVHSLDGNLQEFRHPITAGHVLAEHPNTFFLCNSEEMLIDSHVPHVPDDEELQLGQIYFLMPISMANHPLSLQELCVLATTASSALEKAAEMRKKEKTVSFSDRRKTKSNRNARRNSKVDFQLALKKLD